MKIKLEISDEKYAFVAKMLLEKGIELSDEADFILTEKDRYSSYISCRDEDMPCHVPTVKVLYIESMGHDITVHTEDGNYKCGDTLAQME